MRTNPRLEAVRKLVIACVAVAATGVAGCTSCLGYQDYRLVNHAVGGFGGQGTTTTFTNSGGSGGGGGSPCMPSTEDGTVTVAYVVTAGAAFPASACGSDGTLPGVDVVAVDAATGACVASAFVSASAGTILEASPSVRFDRSGDAYLAGAFRKGTLSFPPSCAGGDVTLDGQSDATAALFFAKLRLSSGVFCTAWARRAFTSDVGAGGKLHAEASAVGDTGLGVTGTLGPALVHFGDPPDVTTDVAGGPFLASFSTDGTLLGVAGLASPTTGDTSVGLTSEGGQWLATGVVENARAECHGCTGTDSVDGPQPSCGGGTGGAGGGGGAGTGGGGGAAPDAPNAMLWQPTLPPGACTLDGHGSDLAASSAQIGFGIWAESSCQRYWTGLSGTADWSIFGPLFSGDGLTPTGFLARMDRCTGTSAEYATRFVPSIAGASAFGHRVAGLACNAGPVSSTVVENAAGGRVDIHRCAGGAQLGDPPICDTQTAEAPLASSAAKQLLLTGFDGDGAVTWSGAVGPLVVDTAAAPLPGRARDDLTTDDRGGSYVVFKTDGPLVTEHLDPGACDLTSIVDPGTWLLALSGAGASGKASCSWAVRLGP